MSAPVVLGITIRADGSAMRFQRQAKEDKQV